MFEPLFYSLANAVLGIIEMFLGLRIILKFFGASTSAPFVAWVYETTQPLLSPFIGAFPSPRVDRLFVIEFSSLFALIIFAFVGYMVDNLFIQLRRLEKIKKYQQE